MTGERNEQMRIEGEIDAALQSLREVRPPAAMVSRIHRSLEAATTTSLQAKSGGRFWIPATCVAVSAVMFIVFSQTHRARRNQTSAVAPATLASVTPAPGHAATQPEVVPAGNFRMRERFSQPADVRRSRREHPQYRHVANLLSYPLTRQEKLLIQFARTVTPEELQKLNPEYQAKAEAQQEAEFTVYLNSGSDSVAQETAEANLSTQK